MTVRVRNRTTSTFKVTDDALDLATHTIRILDNPKIFTPNHEKFIAQMREETSLIYHKCRVANLIRVKPIETESDRLDAEQRLRLQREAAVLCEELMSDIMISKSLFHLRASKVRYWGGKVETVKHGILAWNTSDKKRYKELGL